MNSDKLSEEIETIRKDLIEAKIYNKKDDTVLNISQKLDKLILAYTRKNYC